MAGRIGRVPGGLLGLLDLKTQGQSPAELGSVLLPTLEAFPFYANTIQEQTYTASQFPPAGTAFQKFAGLAGAYPMGPQLGSVWWVRSYQVLAATAAATTLTGLSCAVITALQPAGTVWGAYLGNVVTLAASSAGVSAYGGFWMMPGDTLGYYLSAFTASPAIQGMAIYSEFPY